MSTKTLQAFSNRVIVEPTKAEERHGAIVIPDGARKKPLMGKVVHVGDGEVADNIYLHDKLSVGQTVFYTAYAGTEIEYGGKTYLVLSSDDILATEKQ